ncbi:very-long-chain 3-oxoacyl-CoA reductase-B-like [Elgaria multicarinata webbii]|uniref:very-long-chain 3-oxoacyl-CoA reductase-B-like n=1 Tax=Elgaria multicarinata webbii TaxID=159646 RepID=UPI002FCCCC30
MREMASQGVSILDQALPAVGGLTLLWLLLKAAWGFGYRVRTYVLSEVWKGLDLNHYGPWAVVTGATAGIGKIYAHELAKRGLNVVLISRSLEKLMKVAAEIEQLHGRCTRVIQADFTSGSEIYEPIQTALQGLEIGILVNNVGMAERKQGRFLSFPNVDKHVTNLVNCNLLSAVKMTQIVLPQMLARKKGIVINMSSSAGRRPLPLNGIYSPTKAALDFFSQALDVEYGSKGIIVQSVLPMFVATDLMSMLNQRYMITSEAFVHQALNTVGITNRTVGCLFHSIQWIFYDLLFPKWFHLTSVGLNAQWVLLKMMDYHKKTERLEIQQEPLPD